MDVTDGKRVSDIVASLDCIDVLINATGVIRRDDEHEPEVFSRVVDVNLNGTMCTCAAARARRVGTPRCADVPTIHREFRCNSQTIASIAEGLPWLASPLVKRLAIEAMATDRLGGCVTRAGAVIAAAWLHPRPVDACSTAHVWEFTGNDLDRVRSELPDPVRERLLHDTASAHEQSLDRLVDRYELNGLEHHACVERGEPEFLLPKMTEEKGVDLLVMGTMGRAGIPGFLMGGTAEAVLRQVRCALLTVKPEGFQTPVTLES